ncbi:MAG: hypothetical protein IJM15_03760 [Erysipelotrichaceae bacterium]|nr:hypothetical protein [Erysipelotrichaceae bacterium]
MIIGIDIDGCMTDDDAYKREQTGKYLYEHGLPEMDIPYGFEKKMSFFTYGRFNDFFEETVYEYWENTRPFIYVAEVMKKLKEDGHKLIICTGRHYTQMNTPEGEKARQFTRDWLDKYGIVYDELVFTTFPKIEAIRKYNLDLFIEDAVHTVESVSKEMPVLIFDTPYNRGFDFPNVKRVFSWYDILRYVREHSK